MNLLLLEQKESTMFLPTEDVRVKHIREVLRMTQGDQFYVGIVNGPRGKANIIEDKAHGITFEIKWESVNQKPFPITLLVGLLRPQIARKILEESTSMGVARILFFTLKKERIHM